MVAAAQLATPLQATLGDLEPGGRRSWLQHSARKSLTKPKWSVKYDGSSFGTSQPGKYAWIRSWNAVSSRISFGMGPKRWPYRSCSLDVDVEVADHDDSAVGADALFAAAELARLHIALEDVDAFLRVERDARYLVETDDVVLGYQPSPASLHC